MGCYNRYIQILVNPGKTYASRLQEAEVRNEDK